MDVIGSIQRDRYQRSRPYAVRFLERALLPADFTAGGRAQDCPVALQQFSVR
jgi:hypothetical protein